MDGTSLHLIKQAKAAGADRIYGFLVEAPKEGPRQYVFRLVDCAGHKYFERRMLEPTFVDAVTYWQQLQAPGGSPHKGDGA